MNKLSLATLGMVRTQQQSNVLHFFDSILRCDRYRHVHQREGWRLGKFLLGMCDVSDECRPASLQFGTQRICMRMKCCWMLLTRAVEPCWLRFHGHLSVVILSSCSSSQFLCPPMPQTWTTAHVTTMNPPSCTLPMEVISWRSVYSSRIRQQVFTVWPSWRYDVILTFSSVFLCIYLDAWRSFNSCISQDYKLVFGNHKGLASQRWHGGVATIEHSPGDEVWGVVWRMNISDVESLDRFRVTHHYVKRCFCPDGDVM